jgi:hypothetical protein
MVENELADLLWHYATLPRLSAIKERSQSFLGFRGACATMALSFVVLLRVGYIIGE